MSEKSDKWSRDGVSGLHPSARSHPTVVFPKPHFRAAYRNERRSGLLSI
jgi:hypothetical protein